MANTGPITITLPNRTQFVAPDQATLVAWAREGRIPVDAVITEAGQMPVVAAQYGAIAGLAQPTESDAVATIIPYRNKPALIGYYVSIAGMIPFLGLLAAPAALVLGIIGVRRRAREPHLKGYAHAIIAIVLGGFFTLVYWGLLIAVVVSAVKR